MLELKARPEPVAVDPAQSAVIVVDMQNAFASKKGMLDLAGADISGAPRVIESIRNILDAARPAGMPVVYLQMGYKADLSDSGGPASPNWHKELGIRMMNCRPELKGKLVTLGTWDFAIVDELTPRPEDLVVVKTRYSGFAHTALDTQLQKRGIRYLFFTGIATNVCVESTLRDAYFLDYWPILITDAAMAAGTPGMHEATVHNVENFFGWTIPAAEFIQSVRSVFQRPATAR
ncbi:MAG TPA: isochorismatase family protein [Bryobacteraceae bacterium]|nr:isochorismatase family protein [Bryobacteraceae bacterium]